MGEQTTLQDVVLELARSPASGRVLGTTKVRRDHSIKQQLYFVSVGVRKDKEAMVVCFSHALQNPQTNRVEAREFLKFSMGSVRIRKGNYWKIGFGEACSFIDEVSKLLYYVNDNRDCLKVIMYDLSFSSEEDKFGYRAVTVKGNPRTIYIEQCLALSRASGLLIDQRSGQLFITCPSISDLHLHQPAVIQFAKDGLSAKVVPGKGMFEDKSRDKALRGHILRSRLGHLLVVFSAETKRHLFICSYTAELEMVKCIKIDLTQLLLDCGVGREQLDNLGRLELTGQVHKYVLFIFRSVWFAVRWPKDWYTCKNLPRVKRFHLVAVSAPNPNCTSASAELVGNDLYCLFDDHKQTVTRIKLGERFKDYRCCNNCNIQETHKRKNKQGKRIAQFKVCRMCKEKNVYTYYCSQECVKAQWMEHKLMHRQYTN